MVVLLYSIIIYDPNLHASDPLRTEGQPRRLHPSPARQVPENRFRISFTTQFPVVGIRERKLGACVLNQPANQNVHLHPRSFSQNNSLNSSTASSSATSTTILSKTCGSSPRTQSSATDSTTNASARTKTTSTNSQNLPFWSQNSTNPPLPKWREASRAQGLTCSACSPCPSPTPVPSSNWTKPHEDWCPLWEGPTVWPACPYASGTTSPSPAISLTPKKWPKSGYSREQSALACPTRTFDQNSMKPISSLGKSLGTWTLMGKMPCWKWTSRGTSNRKKSDTVQKCSSDKDSS